MLKHTRIVLATALLLLSASAQADKTAALVNGVAIPQARVDLRVKIAAQQGQPESPELQKAIRDDLINLEILSQAAAKEGLDKRDETIQQIELARQSILAGAYVQNYAKSHPISEALLKQEYETLKTRVGTREYQLSHILVSTEDEAKKVAAAVKKGSFSKIAKAKSMDPGSKDNGGDLGWAVPSNFVQPFAEAVVALKKGQISAPVQTQFGWHVIKLENTRELKVPTFEEVKPNLEKNLQQQEIKKAVAELRAKAKVE